MRRERTYAWRMARVELVIPNGVCGRAGVTWNVAHCIDVVGDTPRQP
jgi:hypothetical protein